MEVLHFVIRKIKKVDKVRDSNGNGITKTEKVGDNVGKVVAFVPVKLNNERLPGKNTKSFDNGEPLICYILNTLMQIKSIDEIYVYCSSQEIKKYLPEGVSYLPRSRELDSNSTLILEVLQAFAKEIKADTYVLAHATAPFLSRNSIEEGLQQVMEGSYDSALSVIKCNEFLWRDNQPINYDKSIIPRTQDLKEIYIETTGLYIYGRDLILKKNRRTGETPYLVQVSRIEAIDINEPIDFQIANALYNEKRNEYGNN